MARKKQMQDYLTSIPNKSKETIVSPVPFAKVNLANVATSFPPREAGEVDMTLVGHKFTEASKSSGQPTVTLQWQEDDSNAGHFQTYSLQPKALWSLKRDLLRAGASVEAMNSPEADLDEIITSMYGYKATLIFGDPRPDQNDSTKLYSNFKELKDPNKVTG